MATVKADASNIQRQVSANGRRAVEFTLDFDTGDYTTGGLNLATVVHSTTGVSVLGQIGLKVVDRAFIVASAHPDNFYTKTIYDTSQNTVTASAFVILTDPAAPLLFITVAGAEHAAAAVAATRQYRFMFQGS